MNTGFKKFGLVVAAAATFAIQAQGVSSRTMIDLSQQIDSASAALAVPSLDLSPRFYDDWALTSAAIALPLELSPRFHDEWAVTPRISTPSLELSPRSHDDWPLHSGE